MKQFIVFTAMVILGVAISLTVVGYSLDIGTISGNMSAQLDKVAAATAPN